MSSLQTLPKGDSAWLLRKAIERIIQQISVLETNIGSSTTGNSANTQVIFNDNGVLRGDAGLTYNATTDLLSVGAATITGDLTVDTSTLKVDSTNDRVGIGTASPAAGAKLGVVGATSVSTTDYIGSSTWAARFTGSSNGASSGISFLTNSSGGFPAPASIHATPISDYRSAIIATYSADASGAGYFAVNRFNPTTSTTSEHYKIDNTGVATWSNVGGVAGTAMTLNSTGLGVGVTPSAWSAGTKAFQVGNTAALWNLSSGLYLSNNRFYDGANKYIITGAATAYEQSSGSHVWLNAPSGTAGNAITFTQAMTLDASGNLLVGTTSSLRNTAHSFKATGASTSYWAAAFQQGGTTSGGRCISLDLPNTNSSSSLFVYATNSSGYVFGVLGNGSLENATGSYGTISDLRLKENISDARNYLADLLKLRVVKYSLKSEASAVATKIGFIAQEVEQVFPTLVETNSDEVKSIKTTVLIPMLLKAIQELTARVQTLEAK